MEPRSFSSDVRAARARLAALGEWYASRPAGTDALDLDDLVGADAELGRVARLSRTDLVSEVSRRAGPFAQALLDALLHVPRERFVRPTDIAESASDEPLLLDDEGLATISAPHAYLLSYRALDLGPGHRLAELGTGSGYGAALASHLVGPSGAVVTIEIDATLATRAKHLLRGYRNVTPLLGDATTSASAWRGFDRVTVTFAVAAIPDAWLDALAEGGRLVAPVGDERSQDLLSVDRRAGTLAWTCHGPVRYVQDRAPRPGGVRP